MTPAVGQLFRQIWVDPGLDELSKVLGTLGFDLDGKKKEIIQAEHDAKRRKLRKDFRISGAISTFKSKASAADDPPADLATMTPGTTFDWAGCTWQVHPRLYDYRIE